METKTIVKGINDILRIAAQREAIFRANIEALSGYKGFTTFFSDFTIGELCGGEKGVADTFRRAFRAWKGDYKYLTELVLVLNHKIWELYQTQPELARLYDSLWWEAKEYAEGHLKGEEAEYYFQWTD